METSVLGIGEAGSKFAESFAKEAGIPCTSVDEVNNGGPIPDFIGWINILLWRFISIMKYLNTLEVLERDFNYSWHVIIDNLLIDATVNQALGLFKHDIISVNDKSLVADTLLEGYRQTIHYTTRKAFDELKNKILTERIVLTPDALDMLIYPACEEFRSLANFIIKMEQD
jgi:hypothetical protein